MERHANPVEWEVKDPHGFTHILRHEDTWIGADNLAHTHDDPMERPYVLSMLLFKIERDPEQGEWAGYAWNRR